MRTLLIFLTFVGAAAARPAAVVGEIKDGKPTLREAVLQPTLVDGTPVEKSRIVKVGDTIYLERFGRKAAGTCRSARIPLQLLGDKLVVGVGPLAAESCAGQNCSLCEFKDSGGCACREPVAGDGASLCNHTVSSDLLGGWVKEIIAP